MSDCSRISSPSAAADLDERIDQRGLVERPLPARAVEQSRALELAEHAAGVVGIDRADAERDVLEDLDEYAAEPDHHDRPELRIAIAADHDLHALRRHFLDEPAVYSGGADGRDLAHRRDCVTNGRGIPEMEPDAADFALMQDVCGNDFCNQRCGERLRLRRGILRVACKKAARHRDRNALEETLAGTFVERRSPLPARVGNDLFRIHGVSLSLR